MMPLVWIARVFRLSPSLLYRARAGDRSVQEIDPAAIGLIFSNVMLLLLALWQNWGFSSTLWTYWCQGISVGLFAFWRVRLARNFTASDLPSDAPDWMKERPFFLPDSKRVRELARETDPTKKSVLLGIFAWIFLCGWGFFFFIYLMFLLGDHSAGWREGAVGATPFLLTGAVSFFEDREREKDQPQDLRITMTRPLFWLMTMHLVIMFGRGASGQEAQVVFIGIKTIFDLLALRWGT